MNKIAIYLDKILEPTWKTEGKWTYWELIRDNLSWHFWRKYRSESCWCPDYPKYENSTLDSSDKFSYGLFDPREKFVWPCQLNEINCGGVIGEYRVKVGFLGFIVKDSP